MGIKLKEKDLTIAIGVVAAAAVVTLIGILVLRSCIVKEEKIKIRQEEFRRNSIYVYFSDIKKKIEDDRMVTFPTPLETDNLTKISLALHQGNPGEVYIGDIYVVFPPNTTVFSGWEQGLFWQPSARRDATEVYLSLNRPVSSAEDLKLPYIEVLFKHNGIYTISYKVVVRGMEVIENGCTVNVLERIRTSI